MSRKIKAMIRFRVYRNGVFIGEVKQPSGNAESQAHTEANLRFREHPSDVITLTAISPKK